ncbi:MAG: hypothetical protein IANPNBLG_03680 [Bryobacteraceae bacterium]|nr:hypothetical protein [Bryobacteraceae bacterium]
MLLQWIREVLQSSAANVFLEAVAVGLALILAWFFPRLGEGWFRRLEGWGKSFSASLKWPWPLLFAFLLPILLRLIQLPIYPPPQPAIHDEFSYLLIGDTLRHWRLANPTHPLWVHFETIHVFFQPTYASKYPVGQGFALALPQFAGLPAYTGVWLSCGFMSAAVYWMLCSWLTPVWALFGVSVVFLRISTLSAWMHSYWGGAVPAIGGALVLGALARLLKKPAHNTAFVLGLGVFILANSRPYEGFVLCCVAAAVLAGWLWKAEYGAAFKFREVVAPLLLASTATGAFLCYHNWRTTGNPLELPYQHNRKLYGTPQTFYWQPPVPPVPFRHHEIAQNYRWQLSMRLQGDSLRTLWDATRLKLREFWLFFFGPVWSVPLLMLPFVARKRAYRIPLLAVLFVLIAVGCYSFFYPHYLGPIAGAILLVLLACLAELRKLRLRGRPVGLALSRFLVTLSILSFSWQIGVDAYHFDSERQVKTPRTQVLDVLEKMGGSHVVFVRYTYNHDFHHEIVYNGADIDASPIIWARDMGPFANQEVVKYYHGRKFWIFEPDARPPRLEPYPMILPRIPGFK